MRQKLNPARLVEAALDELVDRVLPEHLARFFMYGLLSAGVPR